MGGVLNGAVLSVQIGEGEIVNFVGGAGTPNPIGARERITSVGDKICFKAEITRHADGSFDGVIGDDAADNEGVDMSRVQVGFEGGADKSTIGLFGDHGFPRKWSSEGFEFMTVLVWPIRRSGFQRIVTNVIDGCLLLAPSGQQIRDVLFCVRIVALAVFAPSGVVNSVLQVYEYQCGRRHGSILHKITNAL
jgi:hypothetical protein